jgi:hypothetical protein
MRKALVILPLAFALVACSTSAPRERHWSPNLPARDENWHSPAAGLTRYDANHDGVLTRAELIAGLRAEFNTYDVKRGNCLGVDRVRAINQMRVQQDASQATPLVDWNQDGCIDFNEYSGATLSLFDTLDVNGDGQLTAQELNPAAGGPHGPGGGGEDGEGGRGGHGHNRGGEGGEGGEGPGQ